MFPPRLTELSCVQNNTIIMVHHDGDCQQTSIAFCAVLVHCSSLRLSAHKLKLQSPALSYPHKGAINLIVDFVLHAIVTIASDATVQLRLTAE